MRAYFKTMKKLKQLFRRRKASAKFADDEKDPERKVMVWSRTEATDDDPEPHWVVERGYPRRFVKDTMPGREGDEGDVMVQDGREYSWFESERDPNTDPVTDTSRDSDQGGGEDGDDDFPSIGEEG